MQAHDFDFASLSSDERAQQISTLLAAGLRRLLVRSAISASPKKPPELSPDGLELRSDLRLSGHAS
jgi:hypothetical protein